MQRLGERADPGAQRVHLVADRRHRDRALPAFGGQHVAVARRGPDHLTQPPGEPPPGVGDRGGHRGRVLTRGAGLLGAHPRLPLRGGSATQRIRPPANGIGALLGGAHRQPGFHLDAAGGLGRRGDLLPVDGLGRDLLGLFNVAQPGLEFAELGEGFGAPGL